MRKPRPLPKTLEAARAEIDKLERRMRDDKARMEQITEALGDLHPAQNCIPAVGSRWLRSLPVAPGRGVEIAYEFEAYAHAEPGAGGPLLVFRGEDEKGATYHTAVRIETFHREFDPAPARSKRKRAAS